MSTIVRLHRLARRLMDLQLDVDALSSERRDEVIQTEADPLHGGQHGARPKNSESAPFRYYQLFLLLSLSKEKTPAWHEK